MYSKRTKAVRCPNKYLIIMNENEVYLYTAIVEAVVILALGIYVWAYNRKLKNKKD